MQTVGPLAEQVPGSTAHEDDTAAVGCLLRGLPESFQILLVRRVHAEAIGHRDRLLIEPLQFDVRHMLDLRGLVQQLSVQQFPAQGLSQMASHLGATGPILAGNRDHVHRRGSGPRTKTETLPGFWRSWQGRCLACTYPHQKQRFQVGVVSRNPLPESRRFMAYAIAERILAAASAGFNGELRSTGARNSS